MVEVAPEPELGAAVDGVSVYGVAAGPSVLPVLSSP